MMNTFSFSVWWSSCTLHASDLQDSGSQYIETVSTSCALCQLDYAIEALSIPGGVSVGEVVKNGVSIVFNCQSEGQKGFVDIGRNLCKPDEVLLQGGFFCWSFIDGIKGFFEVVSNFQTREVFEPYFKDQGFALVQVMGTPQQQKTIMHQCSTLLVSKALANFF